MLVLVRKLGPPSARIDGCSKVFIGKDITVDVLEINAKKGHVRLGFTAPTNVQILREEAKNASE